MIVLHMYKRTCRHTSNEITSLKSLIALVSSEDDLILPTVPTIALLYDSRVYVTLLTCTNPTNCQ